MATKVFQSEGTALAAFEKLSAVVTRLQTGEAQPRTVISGGSGHILIGIENSPRTAVAVEDPGGNVATVHECGVVAAED